MSVAEHHGLTFKFDVYVYYARCSKKWTAMHRARDGSSVYVVSGNENEQPLNVYLY